MGNKTKKIIYLVYLNNEETRIQTCKRKTRCIKLIGVQTLNLNFICPESMGYYGHRFDSTRGT